MLIILIFNQSIDQSSAEMIPPCVKLLAYRTIKDQYKNGCIEEIPSIQPFFVI